MFPFLHASRPIWIFKLPKAELFLRRRIVISLLGLGHDLVDRLLASYVGDVTHFRTAIVLRTRTCYSGRLLMAFKFTFTPWCLKVRCIIKRRGWFGLVQFVDNIVLRRRVSWKLFLGRLKWACRCWLILVFCLLDSFKILTINLCHCDQLLWRKFLILRLIFTALLLGIFFYLFLFIRALQEVKVELWSLQRLVLSTRLVGQSHNKRAKILELLLLDTLLLHSVNRNGVIWADTFSYLIAWLRRLRWGSPGLDVCQILGRHAAHRELRLQILSTVRVWTHMRLEACCPRHLAVDLARALVGVLL